MFPLRTPFQRRLDINLALGVASLRAGVTNAHSPQLPFFRGTPGNDLLMRGTQAHVARRRRRAASQVRPLKTLRRQMRPRIRATLQRFPRDHPARVHSRLRRGNPQSKVRRRRTCSEQPFRDIFASLTREAHSFAPTWGSLFPKGSSHRATVRTDNLQGWAKRGIPFFFSEKPHHLAPPFATPPSITRAG